MSTTSSPIPELAEKLKIFFNRFSGVEKKLLLLFVLIIIASVIFQAQANSNEANEVPIFGGNYTEGLVGQPQHINPLLAPANDVDADLTQIVYSGLLKFDSSLNLKTDLAESMPEISPDGREYTLHLRENLFWHDGEPVTADDVVFTYEAIQNPEFLSPLRFSWDNVAVEKIDERTVKLTVRHPSATFIANLTVGILPKHIWETTDNATFALSQFNLEPVGSGPYAVTEIKRGRDGEIRSIIMEANKQFYDEGPYIEKLEFKFFATTDELINAYQGRDIEGLGYVPFDQSLFIQPRDSLAQIILPLPQYQAAFINRVKNPAALDDLNVRLALAKSVDKQKIIDEVYGGQAQEAYGPILPGHLGYHEQIPGADMNIYDPDRARELLEESGWHVDESIGFRRDDQDRIITLSIATNNFSPNVRVAELLKEMWEAIGIQIILNIEPIAELEENYIRPRNYEVLIFSENVGPDPDPFPFWHSSQLRDPGLNLSTFSNSQADQLLLDARQNIPAEQRAAKYRQFQEIFVGDVPTVFLVRSVYVYNIPKTIKGAELNTIVTPAERFGNINKWFIKTKRVSE